MIINREEESGRMSVRMGADILELMGKSCDYLFKKEPGLLREVHEVMEPAIRLHNEELEEKIAMQQEALKEKEIQLNQQKEQMNQKDEQLQRQKEQLTQKNEQFVQHIKNYIRLCKKEGKTNQQTEQLLQEIFSATPIGAKKLLEKYW